MNSRVTWWLLLTALALGGYLYVSGPRPGGRDPAPAADGFTFAPVIPETITSVELLHSNAVLRVERTTNGWNLTVPVHYGAQATAVDAFLAALAKLRPRTHIPPAQLETVGATNGLQAFGLGDGAITVKLESADGTPVLFNLGGPSPLGGQFYFQRVGADGVFTADATFLAALPRTADSWRDRGLFDVRDRNYDRIEVRGKPGFVAEKDPKSGVWRLVKPLLARADGSRLEAVVNALQRVRVAAFVTDSTTVDLEPLGLQPAEVELIIGAGTNDLARVQFGRSPTNAPEFVYARRLANTNVVLVPTNAAAVLKLPLAQFRDRQLVPSLAGADRLQFRAAGEVTVLERRGADWRVIEPVTAPADTNRVAQLLRQLGGLPIVDFPNDVPADLARYGLDRPVREFVVIAGTNELVRLDFGAQDGLDKVFVRRADEPAIYSAPLAELRRLPEMASQLRDLRFDPTNVVQVTIHQRGRTNLLTRKVDGRWTATAAAPGILLDESVNETLFRIAHLDTARYTLPNAKQFELLKFPEVDHEIALQLAPGAGFKTLTLQFGGLNSLNNLFATARFDADPRGWLFEFPGGLYEDILRDFSAP